MFKGQTSSLVSPLLTSGKRMAPPSGQASVSSSRNFSLQSLRAPSIRAPKAPVPRAPGTFLLWGVPAAPHSSSSRVPSVHTTPRSWKGGGRLAGRSDALAPGIMSLDEGTQAAVLYQPGALGKEGVGPGGSGHDLLGQPDSSGAAFLRGQDRGIVPRAASA